MPKGKKKVSDMTDDELVRKLFPKPVVEELKRIAHESEIRPETKRKRPSQTG